MRNKFSKSILPLFISSAWLFLMLAAMTQLSYPAGTQAAVPDTRLESPGFPQTHKNGYFGPAPGPTQVLTWNDTCANYRLAITGTGMGDATTPINPASLFLANSETITWLTAQVAGRYAPPSVQTPDSVIISSEGEPPLTLTQPTSNTAESYTFAANLRPTNLITAWVNNEGDSHKTPRGLIVYAKRETPGEQWTSVGRTSLGYVHWNYIEGYYSEELVFSQPLKAERDLEITAAVIDNNEDERPLVLEAIAGPVMTRSEMITGPTEGNLLNIISLRLPNVPADTDRVTVTLRSPTPQETQTERGGDSLILVGVNASYRCDGGQTGIYLPIVLKNHCVPFFDTFDSKLSGWPKEEDETSGLKPGYTDGEYYMYTKNTNIQFAVPFLNDFTNYEVKTDAHWTNELPGEAYGIGFGLVRDKKDKIQDAYVFQVRTRSRQYRLLRCLDYTSCHYYFKGWKAVTNTDKGWVTPTSHPNPILSIASTNILTVVRDFPLIKLYINDEHLVTAADDKIRSGQVGLNVMSYLNPINAEARFDNYIFNPCIKANNSGNGIFTSSERDLPPTTGGYAGTLRRP